MVEIVLKHLVVDFVIRSDSRSGNITRMTGTTFGSHKLWNVTESSEVGNFSIDQVSRSNPPPTSFVKSASGMS